MTTQQDCSIGIVAESTYGTFVTPTRFLEFTEEGFTWEPNRVVGQGMRVSRRTGRGDRRVTTTVAGSGSLTVEAISKGLGVLLKAATGTASSTLVSGSTYQQLFTFGDTLDSLTIQKGIPRVSSGTVDPYAFLGSMVTSWGFTAGNAEIPSFNFEFDCRDLDTASAYAAPSYASSPSLFSFKDAAVTYGGSVTVPTATALASGGTAVTDVRDFSVSVNNNLNVERFNFGGASKKSKPTVGVREITGSFTAEYDATTYRANHVADTAAPLVVTLTGSEALSTGNATIQICLPAIYLESSTPVANSGDVITVEHNFTALENSSGQSFYLAIRTADTAL